MRGQFCIGCPANDTNCNNGSCWMDSLVYGTQLLGEDGVLWWKEAKVMCIDTDNKNVVLFIPEFEDADGKSKAQYNYLSLFEMISDLAGGEIKIKQPEMPKCPKCGATMKQVDFGEYICTAVVVFDDDEEDDEEFLCYEELRIPIKCPMCGGENCVNTEVFGTPEDFACLSCDHEFIVPKTF